MHSLHNPFRSRSLFQVLLPARIHRNITLSSSYKIFQVRVRVGMFIQLSFTAAGTFILQYAKNKIGFGIIKWHTWYKKFLMNKLFSNVSGVMPVFFLKKRLK